MESIRLSPIGHVRSPFREPAGVPVQAAFATDVRGTVEVLPKYEAGLCDLEGFSHLMLLYHMHLSRGYSLTTRPHFDHEARGLFSTRSPNRPNPIGVSVVRLESREGSVLHVRDLDIVDGTPVLDIKPYIPQVDDRRDARIGWLESSRRRLDAMLGAGERD